LENIDFCSAHSLGLLSCFLFKTEITDEENHFFPLSAFSPLYSNIREKVEQNITIDKSSGAINAIFISF